VRLFGSRSRSGVNPGVSKHHLFSDFVYQLERSVVDREKQGQHLQVGTSCIVISRGARLMPSLCVTLQSSASNTDCSSENRPHNTVGVGFCTGGVALSRRRFLFG
jgi:hypothetical protein